MTGFVFTWLARLRHGSLISKAWPGRFWCLAWFVLLGALPPAFAASTRPSSATADHEARALVEELLAQRPTKELTLHGVFKVRHSDGRRSEFAVTYALRLGADHWESVYATAPVPSLGREYLVIIHSAVPASRYRLTRISQDGSKTNCVELAGSDANVPFAGSDFWLTDLGLEFLHWPEQRLVRDAKITMRLGRPCKVLESINPAPAPGTYRRVVSWIDSELGSLIYAEAYDLQNKRFKVFSLKGFKKVEGRWQVKEMELRNDKADSRTRLEFNFETE